MSLVELKNQGGLAGAKSEVNSPLNGAPSDVRRVHYVLSTHWDREWYLTFQDYRRRLVRLMDRVLNDFAQGAFKGPFTVDGQSIPMEDYLEIRPERRSEIESLAAAGNLVIGPWYVMPDEWLVSGESLIRNLRMGRQVARSFGTEPSNAGFVCDLFGHTGQLPQILKGFGIRGGLIWRGVEPRQSAHVIWIGSDGTELPCYRFGREGYCDYSLQVRRCRDAVTDFDPQRAIADLSNFLEWEAGRTKIPPVLAFDGGDHLEHDMDYYNLAMEHFTDTGFPGEIVHSSLDDYIEEMLEHVDGITEVVRGELRETGRDEDDRQSLITGVLSSRVWIKQANTECQTLLCQWAEPLASMATAWLGTEYPVTYFETAWRWLLMNHPHDSICGCSIDEVHEDMRYRFAQCRQIAAAQADESLHTIALRVGGECAADELRITVSNPLACELDEPVDLTLELPAEWRCFYEYFGYEMKPAFRIFDSTGREVPYQVLGQSMNRTKLQLHAVKYPRQQKVNRVDVSVRLQIPALGYTTITIKEGASAPRGGAGAISTKPTRHPQFPGLATSQCSMENDTMKVFLERDGTLTLTDKRSGHVYERLLTLEDCADIGDGWYHGPAVNDQRFFSSATNADVALIHDGPNLCRFRIRLSLSLPRNFDSRTAARSVEMMPVTVDHFVTLRAGCTRIEVKTTIDNCVEDHRMRVLFPTGAAADTSFSDAAFDVVERKIGLPPDNHTRRELGVEAMPQQSWTAVRHEDRGLAVIAAGLMEAAVCDWQERPIALTLFRATSRTVHTDGQPDGQLKGLLTFNYVICPLAGAPDFRRLNEEAVRLSAGVRSICLGAGDFPREENPGTLPSSASFLKLEGDLVLSSIRMIGGAMEVRVFNPGSAETAGRIEIPRMNGRASFQSVVRVDFESHAVAAAQSFTDAIDLTLRPREIVTLRFDQSL